ARGARATRGRPLQHRLGAGVGDHPPRLAPPVYNVTAQHVGCCGRNPMNTSTTAETDTERVEPTEPLRVVIADDHALVRAGLRSLLGGIPGIEVVAEAHDGHEVVELVARLHPNILLMAIAIPRLHGL